MSLHALHTIFRLDNAGLLAHPQRQEWATAYPRLHRLAIAYWLALSALPVLFVLACSAAFSLNISFEDALLGACVLAGMATQSLLLMRAQLARLLPA